MKSKTLSAVLQALNLPESLSEILYSLYNNEDGTVTLVFKQSKCECQDNPLGLYPDCQAETESIPDAKAVVYMSAEDCEKGNYPYDKDSILIDDVSGETLYPALVDLGNLTFSYCKKPNSSECGCPSCSLLYKAIPLAKDSFSRDGYIYLTIE